MRRKEDRSEDAQKAIAAADRGDYRDAIYRLAQLDMEDPYEYVEHTFRAGRKDQERDDCQDFRVDRDSGKAIIRSIYCNDIGDQPEVGFARLGPDGAAYNHAMPAEVTPGTPMGLWYWRLWTKVRGIHWRVAQIYARFQGNGTAGSLHLCTSPGIGDTDQDGPPDKGMVDRLVIHPDGSLEYNGPEDANGIPIIVNGVRRVLRW